MSNTFDKLSVLDSFIEEVNSYLPEIEANLERLAQSPGDMDALEETYRHTHTIGGAASMMDFKGLAHVAHGMEDILGDALDGLLTVDKPALGLLRRSLGRLHQLLEGVRNGIDEDAVIAKDDADYTDFRNLADPRQAQQQITGSDFTTDDYQIPASPLVSQSSSLDMSAFSAPPMPSFDEVLASFRTPTIASGEDISWPEEPAQIPQYEEARPVLPIWPTQIEIQPSPDFGIMPSSALDALVASTRRPSPQPDPAATISYTPNIPSPPITPSAMPTNPQLPIVTPNIPEVYHTSSPAEPPPHFQRSEQNQYALELHNQAVQEDLLPQAYNDMQGGTLTLEKQTSVLRNVLAELREAVAVIETQRSEYKSFLNGSKDALDRMETWAGQAMGLNLRNSPEQVRRYLPLSVMWVSNSKLKRVLELLDQVSGGVEMTDEQIHLALQQLQNSMRSFSEALPHMPLQSQHMPDAGWSPWEMHVARDAEYMRERVTFERQGDLNSLRAELEAKLREEIRQEYEEVRVPAQVNRAELEQQIRNEVRQEFEERQRLQNRASDTNGNNEDAIRELESRLRSEIEIQVRQDFLSQLTNFENEGSFSLRPPTPVNAPERSRDTTGLVTSVAPSTTPQLWQASTPAAPQPSSVKKPALASAQTSSYSGDIGEEAAEIFRLEAEEHLQTISINVASLEKDPTNREFIQGVRRATHTLKGAAAMMGFRAIADLCHISEDLLDTIMEGKMAISSAILSIILDTAETLDILITGRGSDPARDELRVHTLQVRYADLLSAHGVTAHTLDEEHSYHNKSASDTGHLTEVVADEQVSEASNPQTPRGELSVRVRLQRLDELVNLFGELLVNRSILEERIQRLIRLVADVGVSSNRLADVGQKLESRFEAATLPSGRSLQVMPGDGNQGFAGGTPKPGRTSPAPSHLSDFDELELDRYTEFHQLARGLSEGISDMATLSTEMDAIIRECEGVFARENRLNTTFQDRLMKARLVPLSTMAPRLYRTARAVALKQGKDFEFLLEGEATEVDRTVYEEIAGPLLHLIRNAVNHAIEKPEIRIQKGKSPSGQIKLSAAYEGNQIVITVRDDGTGIDQESVRQSAIARGLIRPDQQLSENDLVTLIFHPGFSTASVLSEESGRGVGLDVVRDSVSRLRGTLVVESTPGQGTAFTMTFPMSLAIQSVMMVRVSGQQFAVPTGYVESIGRLDNFSRATLSGQPAVVVRNELYPLHLLSQYLSLPETTVEEKSQLLLINAGGYRVALVIDEIKGKSDIVMKNLGPHLRQVHGIAGATVLGNGHVVLVLELNDLVSARAKVNIPTSIPARREAPSTTGAISQVRQRIEVPASANKQTSSRGPNSPDSTPPERGKHILVVDDSPSVRRVVSTMLKQNGWDVQMARDGIEALDMISLETPAAVLLDIEMPRMDGYELTSTVRAQEQYRTLPLIVLTSRAAAKHQQRAMALGASAYVIKPYQDEELISTINSLVYGGVGAH